MLSHSPITLSYIGNSIIPYLLQKYSNFYIRNVSNLEIS